MDVTLFYKFNVLLVYISVIFLNPIFQSHFSQFYIFFHGK